VLEGLVDMEKAPPEGQVSALKQFSHWQTDEGLVG
jgi:hypothetical protein